jgi:hypothetical protein
MSGRALVDLVRSDMPPPKPQKNGGGGGLDWLLAVVAIAAVGALGYFGFTHFFGVATPGPAAGTPMVAALVADAAWTEDDTALCEQKARAEARDARTNGPLSVNPSLAPGFAGMATLLECRIETKSARFCDQSGKSALVAEVNDYLGKIDVIVLALNVQGAPMKMLGGMNSEVAMGSDIYELQMGATIEFMEAYHERVTGALKSLARDGIVTEGDFGSFMGMGVPPMIKKMFDGVTAERNGCA